MLDRYNFKQLEKVKSILSEIQREEYKFSKLGEFNKQFSLTITPRQDCYYLKSTHYFEDEEYYSELGYIFGTKVYSKYYLKKYPIGYLAYPKYDLPDNKRCYRNLDTGEPFCYDGNFAKFEGTLDGVCLD